MLEGRTAIQARQLGAEFALDREFENGFRFGWLILSYEPIARPAIRR